MKQIIFLMIVFGFASDAFGDCQIQGNTYVNGDENPNNLCLVCNDLLSQTAWSPFDCSAVEDICVIGACVIGAENKPVCEPRVLPKYARCSDAVCTDGAISQGECTDTNPPECLTIEKRTCDGFTCLDENECAVQCAGPGDCRDGYNCNNNVCEVIRNPDMGNDGGPTDMGGDMAVERDADTQSDTGSDMDVKQDVSEPEPIDVSGGSGCCATTTQKFNPMLLVFAVVCIGLRRRRLIFTA